MTPVTRRRAAQLEAEGESILSPTSTPNTATASRKASASKRKSPSAEESDIWDSSAAEDKDKTTPKRQKLAVRVRDTGSSTKGGKRKASTEGQLRKETPKQRQTVADSEESHDDEAEPTPYSASKQLEDEADHQLSQELKAAESINEPATTAEPSKSKHVVFGDDEDVEKYVAAAASTTKDIPNANPEEEVEEESDDEAPEAVSTSAAAKETQKAAQALLDAKDQQTATLKRKRQERDNLLKQQSQKRKRVEKPEIHQVKAALTRKSDDTEKEAGVAEVEKATTSGRQRAEKFKLPSVLPAEFLTDSESDSEDERALQRVQKPKKIKFETAVQALSQEGRAPRDEVVGSTAYRVLVDQEDSKLAPKAHTTSKFVKEMLMHRRRVGQPPAKTKGFFKRK